MYSLRGLCPLLLTALLILPGIASAVEIVLPRDKVLLRMDSVIVTGRAERGQTLTWSIERAGVRQTDTVTADWGNLFEIFVLLDPGLNRLRVEDQQVEVFFQTGNLTPPPGFAPQRVHAGDIARCEDCHGPRNMELVDGGYPGVCLSCHIVVSANPENPADAQNDPHFQKAVANCGRCHEAHTATDPKLLRGEPAALCGSCHGKQVGDTSVHPAYEQGQCVACHDPHYSGFADSLLEGLPSLCHRCHEEGRGLGNPHPPLAKDGSCGTCHDSHASGASLLRKAPEQLCSACHEKVLQAGHGQELAACSDCHDPHGGLGSGLLTRGTSKVCTGCHEEVGKGVTVHTALDEGCEACHDPHRASDSDQARRTCFTCHDLKGDRELRSLHGDLALTTDICGRCHPPHQSDYEQLFTGNLHYPLTQGKCSSCHGGGDERSVVVEDVAARCRMCHPFEKELRAKGVRFHEPVAEGDCTSCHDPHLSGRKAFLRDAEAVVCRECHEISDATGGKRLHPPAEACTECHAPHGGVNKRFLPTGIDDACLECHEDPAAGLDAPHPALDEGCVACHDPHAGYGPGYMRGQSASAPCAECHEVPDLSGGRTFHTPAEECSECHAPHGSNTEKYLPSLPPGLCLTCHDDPSAGKRLPHAALEEGCLACHDPHTGFSSAALRAPERELCLECHDDPTQGLPHPHTAAARGCSGCHDPHGADVDKMLRAPWTALCRSCHDFKERAAGRTGHEPIDDCSNCHDAGPHGGPNPKGLASEPPELCLGCHDDPRRGAEIHPALEEGCLVCHDPHAGPSPGMLAGGSARQACLACHDDPLAGKKNLHSPASESCAACHEPHAGARADLLKQPGNVLCRRCHDTAGHRHTLDPSKGERFAGGKDFPLDAAEYACIGCHDPHGANDGVLYAKPAGQLCTECHNI